MDGDSATHSPESVAAGEPEKVLRVSADKGSDILEVTLQHIYSDQTYDLGEDPGLIKDGVEDHLQRYLAERTDTNEALFISLLEPSWCVANTRPPLAQWILWP